MSDTSNIRHKDYGGGRVLTVQELQVELQKLIELGEGGALIRLDGECCVSWCGGVSRPETEEPLEFAARGTAYTKRKSKRVVTLQTVTYTPQ